MKIGILGNTNNYPFTFAVLLRELGHDVMMVISEKELLHRPESRYPEFKEHYPPWIVDLSHLTEWDFFILHPQIGSVLDRLSDCDAFILNSYWISYLPFLNAPGIALLTGSDLSTYANTESISARTKTWDIGFRNSADGQFMLSQLQDFIRRQRLGIQHAIAVRYMPRGLVPPDDKLLDELGIEDHKRYFFQVSNLDRLAYVKPSLNNPVIVLCATRLTWKLPVEPGRSILDYKGSDIMVRGLGLFYRDTGVKLDIRIFKKGLHVNELMDLVEHEGLSSQVTWLEEMPLTGLWQEFAKCDLTIDQLLDNPVGTTGLDAMAIGRPIIANARPEMFDAFTGEASPICQASTPEEVCAQLKRLVFDSAERERVGLESRSYIEKYFNPHSSAKKILEVLDDALASKSDKDSFPKEAHTNYLSRINLLEKQLLSTQKDIGLSRIKLELARIFFKLACRMSPNSLSEKSLLRLAGFLQNR